MKHHRQATSDNIPSYRPSPSQAFSFYLQRGVVHEEYHAQKVDGIYDRNHLQPKHVTHLNDDHHRSQKDGLKTAKE